jgi:N-acetylmuramoyl-L-alanine amidase
MPSGNMVFLRFGILFVALSSFFQFGDFVALGAPNPPELPPYVVVIDPGHGGDDHGTSVKVGKKHVREKDIALGLAIRTQRILQDSEYWQALGRKVKVILTRDRDVFVSLERRAEIAKKAKADLFLSIHSNSDPTKKARGVETYFLNNIDGSSNSKLEEIENRHSKKFSSKNDASLLLRSVAADAVLDSSKQAAEILQSSVVDHLKSNELPILDRGVRQGLFYVLLDAQVPAVLLEAVFLSHPKDRELVENGDGRQKIAEGIAKGVLRYLALQ